MASSNITAMQHPIHIQGDILEDYVIIFKELLNRIKVCFLLS